MSKKKNYFKQYFGSKNSGSKKIKIPKIMRSKIKV